MFFGLGEPSFVQWSTVGLLGLARINDKNEQLLSSGELRTTIPVTRPSGADKMGRTHDREDWIDSLFEAHL